MVRVPKPLPLVANEACEVPSPLIVDAGVFYSSFTYKLSPVVKLPWKFLYCQQEEDLRTVIAYITERMELVIVLTGLEGKDQQIKGTKELSEVLNKIPGTKSLIDLINNSGESHVLQIMNAHTKWQRLNRVKKLPKGFVIMGDALCSTNQMHGQGMTNATFQVKEFVNLLKSKELGSCDFINSFYRETEKILLMPVLLSSFTDRRKSTLKAYYIPDLFLKIAIPAFGFFMDGFNSLTISNGEAANLYVLIANREINPWSSLAKRPILVCKIIIEAIRIMFQSKTNSEFQISKLTSLKNKESMKETIMAKT